MPPVLFYPLSLLSQLEQSEQTHKSLPFRVYHQLIHELKSWMHHASILLQVPGLPGKKYLYWIQGLLFLQLLFSQSRSNNKTKLWIQRLSEFGIHPSKYTYTYFQQAKVVYIKFHVKTLHFPGLMVQSVLTTFTLAPQPQE